LKSPQAHALMWLPKKGDFMTVRRLLLASAIGLLSAASPAAAADLATDAKAFSAREAVAHPDLSPDGTSVIYLTPGPGRKTVAVVGDLNSGQFHTMVSSDGDPESLAWCRFASASRAVCRFGALVESKPLGDLLGFSRLIAMDLNGANGKLLGQPQSSHEFALRQSDAQIIDWLGGGDGAVLVNRLYVPEEVLGQAVKRTKKGWGVDRLNVSTLKSDTVESPREAAGYTTDDLGHVRLMSVTDARDSGMLTGKLRYFYRIQASRDWKPLFTVTDLDNPEISPLALDASIDSLYALKKKNGRYALYTIKLDGSMAETLVAENPRVDIDNVIRFGDGQKVIGYGYSVEKGETVYFDPEFKALSQSLSKALPNAPIIEFADASRDGNKLLIFAGSDRDPGRYYLFDRSKKTLEPLMVVRPELEGRQLASVKPITITAPDGTAIPAYLTLPVSKAAKALPAVVLPHGGPSARDEWGFDPLAQFLAARGYAVLQPEYRGSAGFGDAWLNENGFKNWRTSIGDITASAKWLVAQGIADPNKLAILGWSYGGYAALQSAVVEPSLYKAVVAIAPVTDLQMAKDEARNFTNYDLVQKEIGSGPHIVEGSPLKHAAAIRAPVLLVHGTMDNNVRYAESKEMDEALRRAGRQSELLTFKGLDHQLNDSDAWTQMLTKIGELLDRTIGH
jgi:dipeptidyl aminopeptidase/acylaminoacyl peptidase